MQRIYQVAIVGGGPVGVALAVDLGLRGVSVGLVETRTGLQKIPKGQNLTQRTLEHFYFWGIAEDLRAGKVQEVIARLKRVRPKTPALRESLQALIRYYSENAGRMRYDEYLRLGYGIGSGAVESAHKQVVHARFRQAGMRWSEAGARRLLALRLLLLNEDWALLDRLRMVSIA